LFSKLHDIRAGAAVVEPERDLRHTTKGEKIRPRNEMNEAEPQTTIGLSAPPGRSHDTEYKAIHDQRLALIRSYNLWYAFGHAIAHAYFWLMLALSLRISSQPLMIAAAVTASLIVWFAYRVVLTIDRGVVALYPRIVFLEIMSDYDFYRDYLRNRPRGDTERSFIETAERIEAPNEVELWQQIYSQFREHDFPADRRITAHFRSAALLSIALFWIIVAVILGPQYLLK
jgi:hypothetical protein